MPKVNPNGVRPLSPEEIHAVGGAAGAAPPSWWNPPPEPIGRVQPPFLPPVRRPWFDPPSEPIVPLQPQDPTV